MALAAGAVLLVAMAVWGLRQRGAAQPSGSGAPASTTPATAQPARPNNSLTEVDLKALHAVRPEPAETSRNPFRFRPKPVPAPSPAIVKQLQQAAAEEAARGPVEPPPPPRIPLKYIGDMADPKNPGKRIAILSDARGTYYGREGDVVEGRYRILRMGVESIELAYLDGRGRQTIRQTGQ
jgi:hypothetical protein